jgi:hypothetical protein
MKIMIKNEFCRKKATTFFYASAVPSDSFHFAFLGFLPFLTGGGESRFPCFSPFLPVLLTRFSLPFLGTECREKE